MKFFLIIVFIIAVIFGIVAFQNNTEVSVTFIKWNITEHIAIILGIPFLIGLVAGISLLLPSLWKKAAHARQFKKRVQELEEGQSQEPEQPEEELPQEPEATESLPEEKEETFKP
jgi:uncharacterized integral membrane protein